MQKFREVGVLSIILFTVLVAATSFPVQTQEAPASEHLQEIILQSQESVTPPVKPTTIKESPNLEVESKSVPTTRQRSSGGGSGSSPGSIGGGSDTGSAPDTGESTAPSLNITYELSNYTVTFTITISVQDFLELEIRKDEENITISTQEFPLLWSDTIQKVTNTYAFLLRTMSEEYLLETILIKFPNSTDNTTDNSTENTENTTIEEPMNSSPRGNVSLLTQLPTYPDEIHNSTVYVTGNFSIDIFQYPDLQTTIPDSGYRGFYLIGADILRNEELTSQYTLERIEKTDIYPLTKQVTLSLLPDQPYTIDFRLHEYKWGQYNYHDFLISNLSFTTINPPVHFQDSNSTNQSHAP